MKKATVVFVVLALVAAAGVAGVITYLSRGKRAAAIIHGPAHEGEKTAAQWTCGMHPQIRRAKPGNCPICNMPLIPVTEEVVSPQNVPPPDHPAAHQMGAMSSPAARENKTTAGAPEEKTVYVGCGMETEGHCPHCDEGKPDAACICGGHAFMMAGEALQECPVCKKPLQELTADQVQSRVVPPGGKVVARLKLTARQKETGDIRTENVMRRHLSKTIRTVGEVAHDPELYIAEEEYVTAVETARKVAQSSDVDVVRRAEDLLQRSRSKLLLLGLSEALIDELQAAGKPDQSLTLPQERMWVYASIYENEIGWVKTGMAASITTTAFPGEVFKGTIGSINPVLDEKTRSVLVRIRVDNPEMKLKPNMYADVVMETMVVIDESPEVLAVPEEAVLDTGTRKIVYVEAQAGEYLGKEVRVGPLAESRVEGDLRKFYPVLEGLEDGETIVTRGNFLLDSQSQLSGSMSVLWGGAQEIKTEEQPGSQEPAAVQTQHNH